jgi:predicted TIM-barrel fold metal-dependent hydrolase
MVKAATDFLGDHCVMFETDYPHPTCLYPNGRESLKKSLSDVSDETVKKIVQDNAAQLYRIAV